MTKKQMPTSSETHRSANPSQSFQNDDARDSATKPHRLWLGGAVALLVLAASFGYLNANNPEFFFDSVAISNEPRVRSIGAMSRWVLDSKLWPGSFLSMLTFSLNRAFNEARGVGLFDPTSYLVVNVAIHAVNSVLVFTLICRMMMPRGISSRRTALLSAVLWAVHPLHANSVVYIVQRSGLLSAMFYLMGMLAYLRLRQCLSRGPRAGWFLALLFLYVCSFKCKAIGLTLPLALAAMEYCLRGGACRSARTASQSAGENPRSSVSGTHWMALTLGVVAAGFAGVVFLTNVGVLDLDRMAIRASGSMIDWGVPEQFLTMNRVLGRFWQLILLPFPAWMTVDHYIEVSRSWFQHGAVWYLALHGLIVGLALWAARRGWSIAAFGVLLFYAAQIPYLIIPQSELFVEYKTYLSSVGAALMVAELLQRLENRTGMAVQVAVTIVCAGLLMSITVRRNAMFRDTLELWADVLAKSPKSARAQLGVANALEAAGKRQEALSHLSEALRLEPGYHPAMQSLANIYVKEGRHAEAEILCDQLMRIKPKDVHVRMAKGSIQITRGQYDEGIALLRETLPSVPPDDLAQIAEGHFNLGNALTELGRWDEALEEYRLAETAMPGELNAYIMRGNVFVKQGKPEAAVEELRNGLSAASVETDGETRAKAHYNMANSLADLGQLEQAEGAYREALAVNPRHANAYYGLGLVLTRRARYEEAVEAYGSALGIDPNHSGAQIAMDAALATLKSVGGQPGP